MALSVGYHGMAAQVHDGSRRSGARLCASSNCLRGRSCDDGRAGPPGAGAYGAAADGIAPRQAWRVVEIEMSGARIRVEPGVELATLSTVLSALRGIR